jgi:hypothetical protein
MQTSESGRARIGVVVGIALLALAARVYAYDPTPIPATRGGTGNTTGAAATLSGLPACTGGTQALGWDGGAWGCVAVGSGTSLTYAAVALDGGYTATADTDVSITAIESNSTITLPTAAVANKRIVISDGSGRLNLKPGGSSYWVAVTGTGGQTVGGFTTAALLHNYGSTTFVSNGTNWVSTEGAEHVAVDPRSISGIIALYEADKGITETGIAVSGWADQSGNGYNLTQTTDANRPVWHPEGMNGVPTIQFGMDKTTNTLTANTHLVSGDVSLTTAWSVFAVATRPEGVNVWRVLAGTANDANTGMTLLYCGGDGNCPTGMFKVAGAGYTQANGSATIEFDSLIGARVATVTGIGGSGPFFTVSGRVAAADTTIRFNGRATTRTIYNGAADATARPFRIGTAASAADSFYVGHIGMVGFWTKLTDANHALIEQYMARKWGVWR